MQAPVGFEDGRGKGDLSVRGRRDRPVLPFGSMHSSAAKARLARVVRRAPEVMVKITGKTRSEGHLKSHLEYISRRGALVLEGAYGERLQGLQDVRERASDWAEEDPFRRDNGTLTFSVLLSMPAGTKASVVRDAARQFALETFGERHDYVFALHTDVDHPHVHLAVTSRGSDGRRLNPRKADLAQWRETFARTLRDRDVEAEATPRRLRGVTRRPLKLAAYKLQERRERALERVGAGRANEPGAGRTRDFTAIGAAAAEGQLSTAKAYLTIARELAATGDHTDHALALETLEFVRSMPLPGFITRSGELGRVRQPLAPDRER